MALIAVRAVVDVSVHPLVSLVRLVLIGVLVTSEARENQIVLRIRVARVTGRGPAVRLREIRMVEHRAQPARRAVAGLARGREARRSVIGICRAVVVSLVATDARRIRNVVVVIDVTLRAGYRRSMETCQRPARRGVVELAVRPQNGVVAGLAGRRESDRNVINRCLCVVVIRLVARYASGIRQRVVVVHMALRARRRRMETSQRPSRRGVVELAIRPQHGVVAAFARCREAQPNVVDRSLRVVVVRLVAAYTRRVGDLVVAVHVALQAGHGRVETRQRPPGRCVIERTVRPEHRVMAALASRREARSNMIHRRLRVVVVRLVARHAIRAGQVVVVVDVAERAWSGRVEARQRPAGRRVIERPVRPKNRVVALRARRRIVQRNVIDRRLRVVVVRLVARHAIRICQAVVVVDVAERAWSGSVEARQRPTRR